MKPTNIDKTKVLVEETLLLYSGHPPGLPILKPETWQLIEADMSSAFYGDPMKDLHDVFLEEKHGIIKGIKKYVTTVSRRDWAKYMMEQ